jgi:3-hydroxyisobutyrate dehydrogenase
MTRNNKTDKIHVGYVGLGATGGALARRLMLSRKIHVFDIRTEVVREFAEDGALATDSLPSLARACDIIFICLPTSAAVRDAIFGEDGMAKGLSSGKVIIDQTTGDPFETRNIARDLAEVGVQLVDAPVSGGPRGAVAGTISIMCGGQFDVFETVRPVIELISPNFVYCGETGNGHGATLVDNAVAACNRLITYEAVTMGFKYGLSIDEMSKVINMGTGWSAASERILPVLGSGGQTEPFQLKLMVKDLRLASQIGMRCGAPMLIANMVRSTFETGSNELGGSADLDQMKHLFEAMANVKFTRSPLAK